MRISFLRLPLVISLALVAGCWAFKARAEPLLHIPVRWCGVEGAPSMENPGALGEASTDDVLWRRHERPSDRIYIPDAEITFRSAATGAIKNGPLSFPIIRDPSGSGGNLIGSGENTDAVLLCRRAWLMGDPLYLDQNGNGVVDNGTDTLLSTGSATAGVVELGHGGAPLVASPSDLGYVDLNTSGSFDIGERIYRDENTNGVVDVSDTLLVETAGTVEGEVEGADVGSSLVALPGNVRYVDLIRRPPGTFNIGYPAVKGVTGVSANDVEFPSIGFPVHGVAEPGLGQCGGVMDDPSQYLPPGDDFTLFETQLVGHEFGHALSLPHGDGIDDNMDGILDNGDDPATPEVPDASPGTLCDNNNMMAYCWRDDGFSANPDMVFVGVGTPTEGILTAAQEDQIRNHVQFNCETGAGGGGGGAATLITRVDGLADVAGLAQHLDITGFTAGLDLTGERSEMTLSTRRPFPQGMTDPVAFHFLVDLDGNAATGAQAPADTRSDRSGIELVVSVRFDGPQLVERRLRRFDAGGGQFEDLDPSVILVRHETLESIPDFVGRRTEPTPIPLVAAGSEFDVRRPEFPTQELIRVSVPFDRLRFPTTPFRVEYVSVDLTSGLADRAHSAGMVFELPEFPSCRVEPEVVQPGGSTQVVATGLLPGVVHHLLLGDEEVGQGASNAAGGAELTLHVPADARPGPRLVTVGALAVTADCTVTVGDPNGGDGDGGGDGGDGGDGPGGAFVPRHQVGLTLGGMGFETGLGLETGFEAGFRYRRLRFTDRWSWETEIGLVDSGTTVDDGLLGRGQMNLAFHTGSATAPVQPFWLLGAGLAHYDGLAGSDTSALVTLGFGADFRWTHRVGFRLDLRTLSVDLLGAGRTTAGHVLWGTTFSF